jgi:hypothetical protein
VGDQGGTLAVLIAPTGSKGRDSPDDEEPARSAGAPFRIVAAVGRELDEAILADFDRLREVHL